MLSTIIATSKFKHAYEYKLMWKILVTTKGNHIDYIVVNKNRAKIQNVIAEKTRGEVKNAERRHKETVEEIIDENIDK